MQSQQSHESKSAPGELPPLHTMPVTIKRPVKVKLRERDKAYLLKGDIQKLKLTDDALANFWLERSGQRYVMIAYYIDGVWHVSALPSYDFDEALDEKKDLDVNKKKIEILTNKIIEFFKAEGIDCKKEHIVFPDHSFFTGIVHRQAECLFETEEKSLLDDAKGGVIVVSFSCRKKDKVFAFTDRAAKNAEASSPAKLALACNLYPNTEIKDIGNMNPWKSSLRYTLGRSTEQEFFKELTSAIICDLYPEEKDAVKDHLAFEIDNHKIRDDWEKLRALYKIDKAKASLEIQHALVRNLYLYLFVGSKQLNNLDWRDLNLGINEAMSMGINIDYNYIPPDIAKHPSANSMREIVKEFGRIIENNHGFVFPNETPEPRPLIFYLVERGLVDEVNYLLENKTMADQKLQNGKTLLAVAVENENYHIAALLCKHGADIETLDQYSRNLVQQVLDPNLDNLTNLIDQNKYGFIEQIISMQSPLGKQKIFERLCLEFKNIDMKELGKYSASNRYLNFLMTVYTPTSVLQYYIKSNNINGLNFLINTLKPLDLQIAIDQLAPLEQTNLAKLYIEYATGNFSELSSFENVEQYLFRIAISRFENAALFENQMRLLMLPVREEKSSHALSVYNQNGESPLFIVNKKNPAFVAHLVRFGFVDVNFMIKKDQTIIQAYLHDNYINGLVYLIKAMQPNDLVRALKKLDAYDRVKFAVIYFTHTKHPPTEITEILANEDINVLSKQGHTLLFEACSHWLSLKNSTYWMKVLDYLRPRANYNVGTPDLLPLDLAINSKYLTTVFRLMEEGATHFSKNNTSKLFNMLWDQYQNGNTFDYVDRDINTHHIEVFSVLENLLKPLNEIGLEEIKQLLREAFIHYVEGINDAESRRRNVESMLDADNPFGKLLFAREQGLTLFNKNFNVDHFHQKISEIVRDENVKNLSL